MVYITKNTKYKDKAGETIWFPKDEKPYFDKALRRTFNSIEEKKMYMDKHGIVQNGDSDSKYRQEWKNRYGNNNYEIVK